MENENEDAIIEPTQNNDEIEIELDDEVEDEPEVKAEPVKPQETLEARHARLKRQLEQTEKKMGVSKEAPKATNDINLSPTDQYALLRNDVAEEDIADVQEIARIKKVTVAEALKLNITKSILAEKKELRTTAEATHTGATRRSSGKVSDEALLSKAMSGDLPESEEEMARLYRVRHGLK